ncbi:phage tail protein [Lysobacter brunescens]|uniref:Phage tail protein n=1 Tax=Lysobacter brunescens TaxID=262323 RepID=A0ABW2YEQ3_9GAMM
MHLLALGTFVFQLTTLPIEQLRRTRDFRHPTVERVGARPASQYAGPGEEKITLGGAMPIEFSGGMLPIDTLAAIANSGESRELVTGYGEVLGSFVVTNFSESHRGLMHDGMPRLVEFDIDLLRVDDPTEYA